MMRRPRQADRINFLLDNGAAAVDWAGDLVAGDRTIAGEATAAWNWGEGLFDDYVDGVVAAYDAGDGAALMYDSLQPAAIAGGVVAGRKPPTKLFGSSGSENIGGGGSPGDPGGPGGTGPGGDDPMYPDRPPSKKSLGLHQM